ncbi:MAG: hemolysin III family protein [Planctomycetales bacterium]
MNEYAIKSFAGFAEPLCSWSHLAGALVFALLSIPLMKRAIRCEQPLGALNHTFRIAGVGLYCFSVVTLLVISGFYHSLGFNTPARADLLRWDYAAIFLLIAGSFTPPCAILLRGVGRIAALASIWTIAFVGIAVRSIYRSPLTGWEGYSLYIAFGSFGIIGVILIWRKYGATFVEPLVLGGVAYLSGAAVQLAFQPELIPGLVGPHEILHVAVLVGIACNWRFVWRIASGVREWEGRDLRS